MNLIRWWRLAPVAHPCQPGRPDCRPALAAVMCWWCARRWLAGRMIWHRGCADELRYAVDLHLERLYRRDHG